MIDFRIITVSLHFDINKIVFNILNFAVSFGAACPFKCPKKRLFLFPVKKAFNARLSSFWIEVECGVSCTQVSETYITFHKGTQARSQLVGASIRMGYILCINLLPLYYMKEIVSSL